MLALILALLISPEPPKLAPLWKAGQEYLYRGAIKEIVIEQGLQPRQQYQLGVRVLVLSVSENSANVVFCTKLIHENLSKPDQVISVHLTDAVIDHRGKVTSCSAATGLPIIIDGPATWENGFLLPLPSELPEANKKWEIAEPGRLPRRFSWHPRPDSTVVNSEQESIDWQRPRADSTAWRRTDQLTLTPRSQLATKIERTIERRAPAHQQVTSRIITEYELQRVEVLHGPMLQERQRDIEQIRQLQNEVTALSASMHDRATREAWQRLAKKVAKYQASSGSTPYRETLTTLLTTIQAGLENRLSLQQAKYEVPERSVQIGQLAPHFSLRSLSGETITSRQCHGKPTLLAFFQPGSELTRTLAVELPAMQQRLGDATFHCLLLTVKESDEKLILNPTAKDAWLSVAKGQPLLATYGVTTTPHFILLGADGTLLASQVGWGLETRQSLQSLIKKELAKTRR